MVNRRGHTVSEVLVATSLLVVLLGAALPSPRSEVAALHDVLEAETARLLLEGELTLARQEAARGELAPGVAARDPSRWRSARTLRDLALSLDVRDAGDGLLEVSVEARWLPATSARREPRALRLGALVPARRAP